MLSGSSLVALLAFVSGSFARVKYVGVAIPGVDFGCDIDGTCPAKTDSFPLKQLGGGDGAGQMQHFAKDDGMNVFRLSATWQFLLNGGDLGGKLDETNFGNYQTLVNDCLDTGAYCMIDVHNFARYDGGIIGQGGPTNDQFVDLWVQIAEKYVKNDKIIFGLMNEPHDLDIDLWAETCQAVVTAVRKAGANSQMILLPGTNFASAETFVSTGSAEALANITNPDGSTDNLYLDIHKYLDINNSGTHAECTTNNTAAFESIGSWLRENKRQGIISETGASMDSTCMDMFCAQNEFIAANDDVFVGFVGWGAGSFDDTYVLTLTPSGSAGDYTDNKLMKQCILEPFLEDAETSTSSASETKTVASKTTTTDATKASATNGVFQEATAASDTTAAPSTSSDDESGASLSMQPLVPGILMVAGAFFHIWVHCI